MKEQNEIDLLHFEKQLLACGKKLIGGVDEVGRGPLAGPVVVASVIMPMDNIIEGINDSKKLTPKKRDELYDKIMEIAIAYDIEFVSNETIDDINILNATKLAMTRAIDGLEIKPDIMLIDAVSNLDVHCECKSIIHGDALSYSIGAASIIAKVTRDRYMEEMDKLYPMYGFAKHKGYGTKAHMDALRSVGPCKIHRKSFIGFLEHK